MFARIIHCFPAIKGVHRWLIRVWTLCHDHIAACRGDAERDSHNAGTNGKLIASATKQAIEQVKSMRNIYVLSVGVL